MSNFWGKVLCEVTDEKAYETADSDVEVLKIPLTWIQVFQKWCICEVLKPEVNHMFWILFPEELEFVCVYQAFLFPTRARAKLINENKKFHHCLA